MNILRHAWKGKGVGLLVAVYFSLSLFPACGGWFLCVGAEGHAEIEFSPAGMCVVEDPGCHALQEECCGDAPEESGDHEDSCEDIRLGVAHADSRRADSSPLPDPVFRFLEIPSASSARAIDARPGGGHFHPPPRVHVPETVVLRL